MAHFTMPSLPVIRQQGTLAELVYRWAMRRLGL
jgi:hypothetical protein